MYKISSFLIYNTMLKKILCENINDDEKSTHELNKIKYNIKFK